MADIQYLNYGDLQVELLALLTNLANEVNNYVNSQPWSRKRKEKFMSAYSDIMNRGILGASNTTGQWTLLVGGDDLNLDSKDRKDREMYEEAAYFIRNLMESLSTKTKEVENKKTKFSNETFLNDLKDYIGKHFLGGQEFHIGDSGNNKDRWNYLDERDSNGIRGREKRTKKLAEILKLYADSLDDNKYDFSNSPFENLNDFKSKISGAITALESENPNDDRDALNYLGLDFDDWFNNGSGDPTVDKDGNPTTYGQLAEAKMKLDEAEKAKLAEEEAAKLAQEKAEAYEKEKANKSLALKVPGIHGIDAKNTPQAYAEYISAKLGTGQQGFNNMNQLVQNLLEKANTLTITSIEKRQLGNLLYYIRANNPNYQGLGNGIKTNVTDEEWIELFGLHKQYIGDSNKNNFIRLPWQTSDGKYVFADNKGTLYFLRPGNLKKFAGIAANRDLKYLNYLNNFLKSDYQKTMSHTIDEGVTNAMIADLSSLGLDGISAASSFIPVYGTAVSAATGVLSTLAGAYADWSRGESLGSILGTAGYGLTMDVLGLIPGYGVSAKAAKMAKVVSKWSKYIGIGLAAMGGLSYGPNAISAFNKFKSGNVGDITEEELRDFCYAWSAIINGGVRKAGSTYQGNRTLKKALAGKESIGTTAAKGPRAVVSKEKVSANITTKKGKKVELTDDEFKALKGEGSRESKVKLLEKKGVKETDVKWKGRNPVKFRFTKASKSSNIFGLNEGYETNGIKWKTTSADYKGIRRFSNENLLRNYMLTLSNSSPKGWKRIKDRWNGDDIISSAEVESGSKLRKTDVGKDIAYRNKVVKMYSNMQRGRFTSRNVQNGSYKIGNLNVEVKSGMTPEKSPYFSVEYKDPKNPTINVESFKTEKEVKKKIAEIISEQRRNILYSEKNLEGKFNPESMRKMGRVLRNLKRKGWLKQGGKITDIQIDNFLKQYK